MRQRVAVEATFLALFLLAFAESDARSTAVLVDELNAGQLQGAPDGELVGRS